VTVLRFEEYPIGIDFELSVDTPRLSAIVHLCLHLNFLAFLYDLQFSDLLVAHSGLRTVAKLLPHKLKYACFLFWPGQLLMLCRKILSQEGKLLLDAFK